MVKSKNSENKFSNHLQQDVVKIAGKTIFINPFLYWRRFDENTNRWLREPGQMSEEQIQPNRNRFYPEIDWADLSQDQKLIKDASVEMFLKTLELISTFHPQLNSGQLLEVERKMSITKKLPFEKWVKKSFAKKARSEENEKRKFYRDRFIRSWKEWLSLENTQQALVPIIIIVFISAFIGWSLGVSKNSCNPYFEQNLDQPI
ncbi:hypothetical protein OA503_00595 [Prochlorococcus sp. AH-716-K03]|nr:hypothetical protein [Prochlorococcus sp. AH-716-K03]